MRQRAASHPVGLVSESCTRAVEDRADARHCGVSSMRAQAKNQIAQFLPNPGRRILGGAIRNVGNICLRIRFRSHAHDVCSSLAEVSPCGNPPFPCVSKCGCSWQRPSHWPTANRIRFHVRFVKGSNGPSCIRLISCLCRCSLVRLSWIVGVGLCKTTCLQTEKNACDGGGACVATFERTGWFLT